jgi:hypothetical protein
LIYNQLNFSAYLNYLFINSQNRACQRQFLEESIFGFINIPFYKYKSISYRWFFHTYVSIHYKHIIYLKLTKMKNIGKLILATAIMMIFAIQSNAQNTNSANQPAKKQNTVSSASGNFIDKDNNGVCDNFESRSGKGYGANFVDKNGDGICDNRANVGKKSGNNCRNGQGYQNRHGQGQGHGQGRGCGNCNRR